MGFRPSAAGGGGYLAVGPTGDYAPSETPAYNTAATDTATTLSELDTALAAAAAGDVIEWTGGTVDASGYVLDGGDVGWAENVLIRPPLGQRARWSGTTPSLRASRVTLAGLDIDGGVRLENGSSSGLSYVDGFKSKLWRIVVTGDLFGVSGGRCNLDAVEGAEMVEVVYPTRIFNASDDRCLVRAVGDASCKRPLLRGCWVPGTVYCTDTRAGGGALGEIQYPAVVSSPQILPESYTVAGSELSLQMTRLLVAMREGSPGFTAQVRLLRNGVPVPGTTMDVPGGGREYCKAAFTAVTCETGDLIQLEIVSITGSCQRLEAYFGLLSTEHVDTLQMYRGNTGTNTGKVESPSIKDTFLGSSQNAAVMMEQVIGDFTIANSYLEMDFGEIDGVSRPLKTKEDHTFRVHAVGARTNGEFAFALPQAGALVDCRADGVTWLNSLGQGGQPPPTFVHPSNDFTLAASLPIPPDLEALWTECPYTGTVEA